MNDNKDNSNKIYEVDYTRTFLNQEIYNREHEEKNSASKIKKGIIWTLLLTCIAILSFFVFVEPSEFFGTDSLIGQALSDDGKTHASLWSFGMKRHNLLLLGVDNNPDVKDMWAGTRTDTIILANIDPKTKSVNAISIPRDSKVFLAGNKGVNKINSAHAIGGIEMTKNTIEKTLGVKIHRYVLIHEGIVKDLVDDLGGVDIYIEKPMRYRDRTAHLDINFTQGQQTLDGQKAVEYLRFRHDQMGDIGRTQRQQWFIRGLVKKLQEPQSLTKIPDLLATAKKYIKTDISVAEMGQYIDFLRDTDLSKTEIAMLPGQPNLRGTVSYWILDPEKTQDVVNRLIYRDKQKHDLEGKPVVASIRYSKESSTKAKNLLNEFKDAGIEVKCFDAISRTHTQFIAHSSRITNDYFNALNEKVENIDNKVQFVYDPINLYCSGTDFTLILAE